MQFIRLTLAAGLLVALTACGGGGLGNVLGGLNPINGGGPICDAGTQVQLANPQPGQIGVSPTIGQIVIVASGNSNNLYNSYNQWYLTLTNQYGGSPLQGGNLQLTPNNGYVKPYSSDFYYSSSIGQLPAGATWQVNLVDQNTGSVCPLNSFST